MPIHEEHQNHVASGLAMQNHVIDLLADGTAWASASTLATYRSVNEAKAALATTHETERVDFLMANRYMGTLSALDIITDADIGAANTTALWRQQFVEDDGSLPAAFNGARCRA